MKVNYKKNLVVRAVLESLADNVVLAVNSILMLILVICGVVMKDTFDMVAGGIFLGVGVGIIGNDIIVRIVNDEDDDDILDYRETDEQGL